jgi:tetratricopeptide (TPR) repeat protein
MPWMAVFLRLSFGACLAACSSVPPSPAEYAAQVPPERELSTAERELVARLLASARQRFAEGQHDAAEDAARGALRLDPRAAGARAVLGECLAHAGDPVRAEGELLLASHLDPGDPHVALAYARFLERDHHLTAAAAVIDQALRRHLDDAELLSAASRLRFELGEERLALPLLTRLLTIRPQDAEAQYRMAQCEAALAASEQGPLRRRAYEQAARSYAGYRQLRADDVDGCLGEAHALMHAAGAGQLSDRELLAAAERAYRDAEQLAPDDARVAFGLALTAEAIGDHERARQLYRRALGLDPLHAGARLNLAASLEASGQGDEARTHWSIALQLDLTPIERQRVAEAIAARRR